VCYDTPHKNASFRAKENAHCPSERCAKLSYSVLLFREIDFSHGYFPQFFFHLNLQVSKFFRKKNDFAANFELG